MKQLKNGQEVIFIIKDKNYKYKVYKSFLNEEYSNNNQIFIDLKIDQIKFAYSAYGYNPGNGCWPTSNHEDFAALTRLVEALFPYCDKVIVDNEIVYSKSEKTIFKESESSISSSKLESSNTIDFESIVKNPKIKFTFI